MACQGNSLSTRHIDGSRTSLSIRYFSAALILFGARHTFWRYPLRALFATRSKHPKPARTPASTPDPNHARSTTNPSNSLFYLVKLGTQGALFALTLLYQNERPSSYVAAEDDTKCSARGRRCKQAFPPDNKPKCRLRT